MSVPFLPYTQLPRRVPVRAWHPVRVVSVAVFLGLCVALVVRPVGALFFFWQLLVPVLPFLFLLAPGLWRNVCPLAAANQAPRLWGLAGGRTQPAFLRDHGYTIAIMLFIGIVATRGPVLNHNGPALAVLLIVLMATAFATGTRFKGKSGWCSSICPLLPVQRLYGQTPFVLVPNSHCQPCLGCTKNCYDFNPGAAYQADMHDPEPRWGASRRWFAGAFPGLVTGYFLAPHDAPATEGYAYLLVAAAVGAGLLFAVEALLPVSPSQAAVMGGAVALVVFGWYQGPRWADAWSEVLDVDMTPLGWAVRAAVPVLAVVWVWRTLRVEDRYVQSAVASSRPVRLSATRTVRLTEAERAEGPVVTFRPGDARVVAHPGASLLEVAESAGQPIESGCRMGVCGADPVAVLEGADALSPCGGDEASTLQRLGLGPTVRLACSARVQGPCSVSLAPEDLRPAAAAPPPGTLVDPSIRSVVVIGNGIAGVTAADVVRRNHPDCAVHVVAREPYPLYNRMGISRIVHGRSAMQGLQLMPDSWYDDHRVTLWLNTAAQRLDLDARVVELATGERLAYDRLVLATGSTSFVPPLPGWGVPGCFVLRSADDAVSLRRYAQDGRVRHAVVAGGGLLGLEAAHALHLLGLSTTVVEIAPRLLANQADERASELLAEYLENSGIRVVTPGATARVTAGEEGRLSGIVLADGRVIEADVLVVAAGIRPDVDLARDAGITVGRGVVVDDRMRTSAPDVYAAGDVAELDGRVWGLWPIAVKQGEAAARNALGGDEVHVSSVPFAMLKGIGLDLLSAGRFVADVDAGEVEVVVDEGREHRYAKAVVAADGRLVGALLLGRAADHGAVSDAVREGAAAGPVLARLRASVPLQPA